MSHRGGQFTRLTHTNHVPLRRSVYKVKSHKPPHIAEVSLQDQHTQTKSHSGGQFTRWNTNKPPHIAAVNLQGQNTQHTSHRGSQITRWNTQTRSHRGGQFTRSTHTNHLTLRRSVYKVEHTNQVKLWQSVYKDNTNKPCHIATVSLPGQHTQTRSYSGGQFTR